MSNLVRPWMAPFNASATADLVSLIWVIALVAWVLATGHNFLVGTWELASFPAGLATVLAAIPLSKAVIEGARALRNKGAEKK